MVSPRRAADVLCISGIIQNCSWNQPNRGAPFRRKGKRGDSVYAPFPAERLPAASQPRSRLAIALNREATADKSREATRKTNGQFEALTLDTAFSEAVRELAEKSVGQTREAYDRAKDALEAAVDTMARSFDTLGQGVSGADLFLPAQACG